MLGKSWSFFGSIQLSGGITMQNFIGVCQRYYQVSTVSNQICGTTPTDCPLLAAMYTLTVSTSVTATNQVACQQLCSQISTYFIANTDYQLRLEYLSVTLYNLRQTNPTLAYQILSLQLNSFGDIYSLLATSHFV